MGGAGRSLELIFALAQPIQKHLLDRLVVGHEHVADRVSADHVANLFGEILGMVAGPFQRLRHKDDLQAGLALQVFRILNVPQKNQIAQAVHFGVRAEHVYSPLHIASGESGAHISQHLFQDGSHMGQIARVLRVDPQARCLGAAGKTCEYFRDATVQF